MSTLHSRRARAFAPLLALWLAACGGGAELALIPLFEFGFKGTTTGNVAVQAFFTPTNPTTTSGTLSVNFSAGGAGLTYTGTYSGCSFTISTTGAVAPIAASYDGTFHGNDTIELQPTSGVGLPVITLQRIDVGVPPSRVSGC